MSNHAERLRELSEIKTDMALVMGPGTYQDLWRSDAAALLAGAEALGRMEAIQAERDAARAEAADRRTQAARAQEALRHLMNGVPTDDAVWAAYGNVDSARAWLARQRREAAAEALEKLEAECSTVFDGDLPHVTIETIREHLTAFRAGAWVDEQEGK